MRWHYKAAVQRSLSLVPGGGGESANYLLQRHVTKKLPHSDQLFLLTFRETARHLRIYGEHRERRLESLRTFEFGAGWDLTGPLSAWALGVSRQVVVDIHAHLRFELVNHSLQQLASHHAVLEQRAQRPLRRPDRAPVRSLADLRERFGIDYRAPCDARSSGLGPASFDLIHSTFTLEHIPRDEIVAILRECARLLAAGGIVSCSIDMNDHYAFDDPRICVYNFLRYSDRRWRLVNSSLHHQNRLRARDYRDVYREAGLEILEEQLFAGSADQREQLEQLPLAPRFARGYSLDELAPIAMLVVAVRGEPS